MTLARLAALCFTLSLPLLGCSNTAASNAAQTKSAPPSPAMKPAPPTPLAEQKEELGGKTWDPAWDAIVEKAIPPDMLSTQAARAVHGFCPSFAREPEADKRAFWAYFFQALAGAEAGLDKTVSVRHTAAAVNRMDKVTHRPVHQQGLLQVTYDDSERYNCDFNWEHDRSLPERDPRRTILQPANNLTCGVNIIRNQIVTQGKPLLVRTSYFSTLQPGTKSYRVFRKQMANVPAACGVGPLKPRKVAASPRRSTHAEGTSGR